MTHTTQEEIDKNYDEFWKAILEDSDGNIDKEQLKRELSDFSFILGELPKVYSAVTGGHVSKPMTYAYAVIQEYEENLNENYTSRDDLLDWIDYNLEKLEQAGQTLDLDLEYFIGILGYANWNTLVEAVQERRRKRIDWEGLIRTKG